MDQRLVASLATHHQKAAPQTTKSVLTRMGTCEAADCSPNICRHCFSRKSGPPTAMTTAKAACAAYSGRHPQAGSSSVSPRASCLNWMPLP